MPNHYHLLLYLKQKQGIEKLMRSVMTAYSRYFNTKVPTGWWIISEPFWPHTLDQMSISGM